MGIGMYKRYNRNMQNLPISLLESSVSLIYYWGLLLNDVQNFNKNVECLIRLSIPGE